MEILSIFDGKVDLSNCAQFGKFNTHLAGLPSVPKPIGKNDTTHHPEIDESSMNKIFEFCALVTAVIISRDTLDPSCLKAKLPGSDHFSAEEKFKFTENYHTLLQMAVQFILTLFECRRGCEGLDSLTKDHYRLDVDPASNKKFYRKVIGESSKNNSRDDENMENMGIILMR